MTRFLLSILVLIVSISCFSQNCRWTNIYTGESLRISCQNISKKPTDGLWKIESIHCDSNRTAFVEILNQKPNYFYLLSGSTVLAEGNYSNDTNWTFYTDFKYNDTTFKIGKWRYYLVWNSYKVPFDDFGNYRQYYKHLNGQIKKEIFHKEGVGIVAEMEFNENSIPTNINNNNYDFSLNYPFYFSSYKYQIEGWIHLDTSSGIWTTPMIRFKNANLLLDTNGVIEEIIYSKNGKQKRLEIKK